MRKVVQKLKCADHAVKRALTEATASTKEGSGRKLKAHEGIGRCLRVLARLYPGVSVGTLSQRCAEDLRLRLKEVRVCQPCALEIAGASGTYQTTAVADHLGIEPVAR